MTPTYEEEARFVLVRAIFQIKKQGTLEAALVKRLKGFGYHYLKRNFFSLYPEFRKELEEIEVVLRSD